jgi:hypothetical protein
MTLKIQYYLYSGKWINSPKYIEFLLIRVQECPTSANKPIVFVLIHKITETLGFEKESVLKQF